MSQPYPERVLQEVLKDVGGRLLPSGATGQVLQGLRRCYRAGQAVMQERAAHCADVAAPEVAQEIRRLTPEGVQ